MKKRAAFTLVELLVALAITSLLVVLLANVVSATLAAWEQGRNRLDTFSTARQLMNRLTDEMTAAVAATGQMEFVEDNNNIGSFDADQSENIFFVAPYPNFGAGDLCVVMYRHNKNTFQLERRFVNSADAWSVPATDRYKLTSYPDTNPSGWRMVADGVVNFEMRCYPDGDDTNQAAPAAWNSSSPGNIAMQGKTPRRIVIRLKVVDDRTLVRLTAMGPSSAQYAPTVQRAAREFYTQFHLPKR